MVDDHHRARMVDDHYDSYTYNLVHLVAAVLGRLPHVVQHDRTTCSDLARYDAVVLSPGPGSPEEPSDFAVGRALLEAAATPILGVCLGMQGLVSAFGGAIGRVRPGHGRLALVDHERTGLFTGLPQGFDAVRYHSLAAITVPDCLEVTASDRLTGLVMGVRHRDLPLVGVQFHPESILTAHGAELVANFFIEVCG